MNIVMIFFFLQTFRHKKEYYLLKFTIHSRYNLIVQKKLLEQKNNQTPFDNL